MSDRQRLIEEAVRRAVKPSVTEVARMFPGYLHYMAMMWRDPICAEFRRLVEECSI